ncbi:hypothetical protein V5O48_007483 [Marasmius crinis-equi]|uniref:Uncharacterized protein n=1 Tax=Marasmius crinis-equi TaxID=585013 RepID=A0ABR3FGM7_9AGAR
MPPSAPSSTLPPLARLSQTPALRVSDALDNIRQLYWPPQSLPSKLAVPTRKHLQLIHDESVPDSGYASADEDDEGDTEEQMVQQEGEEATEILRADPFERAFAIKWVTGFIARSDIWVEREEDECEAEIRAEAVDKATSIVSAFTGNDDEAAQCAVTRSLSFSTATGGPVIHVELNDAPLSTEDHTSVGLQSWASSIVLAEKMSAEPGAFSLDNPPTRILELGAGTGLLSIAAAKILQRQAKTNDVSRLSSVIATDYHPAVLANLTANVNTNFPRSRPISVLRLDWETPDYTQFHGQSFDVILAADVIYHPQHAKWIKGCVEQLLTRPSCTNSGGHFWLIIPLRTTGRHENMDHTVDQTFPDASNKDSSEGMVLAILHRESFARQGGVGRADEGGYKLFKIGWVA